MVRLSRRGGVSANHLYITFNAFNSADQWLRAFVFKLPLETLKPAGRLAISGGQPPRTAPFASPSAATSMHFASHNGGTATGIRLAGRLEHDRLIRRDPRRLERGAVFRPGTRRRRMVESRRFSNHGSLDQRDPRRFFLWTAAAKGGASAAVRQRAVVDVSTRALPRNPTSGTSSRPSPILHARTRRASSGCRCSRRTAALVTRRRLP